nr:zinc finger, CCHC-type [Tanacetum cinerariifolium]
MFDAATKHMASNFAKLDKFEGVDFRIWQKKMHFLLFSMSVVYVLTTPISEDGGDDATVEQIKKRARFTQHKINMDESIQVSCIIDKLLPSWKDFKHTLKHKKEELTLVKLGSHLRIEESLRMQDSDKPKVLKQYYELLGILGRFTQHKINMDESIQVSCIIDKLLPSWKDFKHTLKHKKEELTLVKLGSHLRIEESLRMQDSDKPKGNEKYFVTFIDDASRFCYVSLLHTKDEALDKLKVFKTKVELQQGFLIKRFRTDRGGEYMDIFSLLVLFMKRLPHILHNKMVYLEGKTREVVRIPDPKSKTLGERGIECIFVGYVEHSKAFRFYVIEPNDSVSINFIIESRDEIFDENRFSLIPRPSLRIPNGTEDIGGLVVSKEVTEEVVTQQPEPELKKGKRNRTSKDFGSEFQLYLIEGTRDESQDVAFWKEAINNEMNSIMGINTWVLADLNLGCKPLCCKWIFKRRLKVDETIEKFKARLIIQGFKQKLGINYFDTYAPVEHISTIRLLIAMASIHNLIIHQMDVKTTFLTGDLDKEIYINQPQGFIMPGNENKVRKLIKSLCGLKQVDLTKEFLSSRFFMKDMGEADVILGIKIKHESNGIAISQSHYIEKVLKKFNYFDCTPVSTPLDTSEKIMPNNGQAVSQLEYSRVIGCLMYGMTCIRPDIAFVMGKLSRYTSNPSTQHWQAIQRVLKYLKKTMDYRLTYIGYPSVLEAAGKEAEWLKNFLHEIPLWSKPMALISIRCDSAATLAKAYRQMYNGKSRHLDSNFSKLDKFEGVDFRRWQKKMHFLLSSMRVVYVLTTPILEDGGDDATVEQIKKRAKWDNDDYVWKAKYMVEDASSKKFLVSNFTNYKMTDSRPFLKQYNELLGILGRFTQHKMNMDESIQVSCIIDKLPPSWKDFKHTLKHKKEEFTLVKLGSHLRIKETLRMPDSDKPKGSNVAGP